MLTAIKEIIATLFNIIVIFFAYIKAYIRYFIHLFANQSVSLFTNALLRILRVYLDTINNITAKIFWRSQKGKVPPITDRILLQPANELVDQIKSGKLKSETLVKAYIDRIKTVEPHINAVVDERYAAAVLEAIEIDKRVEHEINQNEPLIFGFSIYNQPLLGIPFSCKDSIGIEGMAHDGALETRKGVKANADSSVISLLRKSGAIPLVLTNIPEILMWWDSYNKIYGRTNNPYDLSRIPGGSSGGEGALISSAASVIGVGSDIGGSIRIPSFCCGIFGHKPTPGIVPIDGAFPENTAEKIAFNCFGPMTRYASDILPMLQVMAAPNASKLRLDESVDLSKIKIYFMEEDGNPLNTKVDNDIKHAINKIVAHMTQKYGNYSRKVEFDKLQHGYMIWLYSLKQANVASLESELTQGKAINVFTEIIKYFLNRSKHTLSLIFSVMTDKVLPDVSSEFGQKYVRLGRELKQELKQLIGSDGIFIYPTQPEPAVKHYSTILKVTNVSYTCIFNVLGLPVTQCPLGLNKNGLPIGAQIVSAPHNDHITIAVANELEKAFGGWSSPSRIVC